MSLDPESLYLQLGRLVESMPNLAAEGPIPPATQQWLGRAYALVEQVVDTPDRAFFTVSANNLNSALRESNAQTITAIVHRALAKAELSAPVAARGAFITAGNAFDAFAALGNVLNKAKQRAMIVDPYMDEKALTDFAPLVPENVAIRLLADGQHYKPALKPAATRWVAQYGASRPLEVRLAAARTLHDRLITIDDTDAWTLTQSLNAFASRSPATIVRIDPGTAALKIAAYDAMWQASAAI